MSDKIEDEKPVEVEAQASANEFQQETEIKNEATEGGTPVVEKEKAEEEKVDTDALKAASKANAQVINPVPVDGGSNTAVGVGEKPVIPDSVLTKIYHVRYALSQAQKRIAVNRDMRLFNILETLVHSHVIFIGFKKKKDMDEVSEILKNGTLMIRNTKIDRGLVEDIDGYLKMNTQYVITRNM